MGKIDQEKRVVARMICLYCNKYEGNAQLCDECRALMKYAEHRLSRCPFKEQKPTCRLCPIHCYKPDEREKMQRVMRFAGPRMMWHYPLDALRHLISELKTVITQQKRVAR